MAEFKISRFRYTWKGDWVTGTDYTKDDVVKYGGSSYVCLRGHTASAGFYTDIDYTVPGSSPIIASPAWTFMTKGTTWRSDWVTSRQYNVGDIVQYGGNTYLCLAGHTSAVTFVADTAKWEIYVVSVSWKGLYTNNIRYAVGDIVRYGGIVYKCITEHTSTSDRLEPQIANWTIYYSNVDAFNTWTQLTAYKVNDLVKYGGSIWKCVTAHTGELAFTADRWRVELYGYQFGNDWASLTLYQIGDVVRYGGYLYYSQINNNDLNPRDSEDSTIAWTRLAEGYNPRGEWLSSNRYLPGDLVRRGGNLYVAINENLNDGSSFDYLSTDDWQLVVPGFNWRNRWLDGVSYALNDLVIYQGSTYKCVYPHISTLDAFPGDNGSVFGLWEIFLQSGDYTGLINPGDLLTWNLSRIGAGDGSTINATPISIGQESEVLKVSNEDLSTFVYEKFGSLRQARYVSASSGVDREDYGSSPFTPYRTIRYACEQVEELSGNFDISVNAGLYEEILPIIVPAGVCIKGVETRSTTVIANDPIASLALDSTYTKFVLDHLSSLIDYVITGTPATGFTIGTTELQDTSLSGSAGAVTQVTQLITDIKNYITFYIESGPTDPTLVGTNVRNTANEVAAQALENNKEFLANEAVAFMQGNYPNYAFDSEKCKRDVRAYINAWKYDILYTGNYKSLYAARYYRNAVLGSALEDMFYLRDATGVRNMTLKGLIGYLNPPGVYEFYQRPTGGAYTSLDPGWGPDDDRTWIQTRSPYIQNCATFGFASVGQKIDGSLHNGGNRSFVSNDFTQLIDDGIGAWVINGGRAELVSVFTYYSQVGYLTENGGIIRATNGNNSFGRIGAMALGTDDTETPIRVTVNTRNHQPIVTSTFTGLLGSDADKIILVEYRNAGQNYTSVTWTVSGAGVGASIIQEEYRDRAVFEALEYNPIDSTGVGGTNFTFVTQNASTGTTTSIKLAGVDTGAESEYLGLRILIVSGTGSGQYGYITAYNATTKIAQVSKESDGTPGWDHVLPGFPIAPALLPDTRYEITPRVTFTAPDYNAYDSTLPATLSWRKVVWGETNATYTNIAGSVGAGTVDGSDGLVPITATWNVVKNGRTYTVLLNTNGAGYADEQVITIKGSLVGGADTLNDITIRVTSVSNDSTNTITGFVYSGEAASGNFVAFANSTDKCAWSPDGIDWTLATLPATGNWTVAASGGNKFIALIPGTTTAAWSNDGVTWFSATLPSASTWTNATYGNGTFVVIASNLNRAAYSTNGGATWTATTMPTFGDSTYNTWISVTYGQNLFYAIAQSGNIGAYSSDGISWQGIIVDATNDSSQLDWIGITYGAGRFVALSQTGQIGYSFDGQTWYQGANNMPTQDGSTIMNWNQIKYGQGVFVAVCDTASRTIGGDTTTGPTTMIATSEDGIAWTIRDTASAHSWVDVRFGNPKYSLGDSSTTYSVGTWIAVGSDSTNVAARIYTGARAKGRAVPQSGIIPNIRLWDVGSGYMTVPPTITVTDPNNFREVYTLNRLGDGVLGQPTWLNRGQGYKTKSTTSSVVGNGFADVTPSGKYITLSGFTELVGPGAQLIFDIDTVRYRLVTITGLGDLGDGTLSAFCQVSPTIDVSDLFYHGLGVSVRTRYSQNRITGHDFLNIGTGNFLQTNYPALYSAATFNFAPENEAIEGLGGRVFYTSTDQDGNFRTGELFSVQQATGIVTISADFFDLAGLTELRLGGIRLGGSGVVIRDFSTDPTFAEDSNNIVPTQKAIASYLSSKLSVAGADLVANSFTAGEISVGEGAVNISNYLQKTINFPVNVDFSGRTAGVTGYMWAQAMFYRSFRDD